MPKKSHLTSRVALVALLGATLLTQTGCFTLAVGAAAVGTLATLDRRTYGAQTDDQTIELKAGGKIRETVGNPGGIGVTSFNRRVLLTGQVLNEADRKAAETATASVENVKFVHNELAVSGRVGVGTITSDTVLTTKVRAAFIETKGLQSNAFKIVTENGIVYLMGVVTEAEGAQAAQVASRVGGVSKVVTVYEFATAQELQRLTSQKS
jgi:osmotically-inducible protein OsmY